MGNFRQKSIKLISDTTQLDTLSIVPKSFRITKEGAEVDTSLYWIDYFDGYLIWKSALPVILSVEYRVLDFSLSKPMKRRSLNDRRF
jgi:hypothetical protein